ncbi:MAG: ATP-binding protein [Defluviitaleaceae bacterium]|nr:ATP-binding protein [Defluviitaleaceae bacterium]
MQKRIYRNFVVLILVCIVTLAISFGLLFMNAARTQEMAAIRDNAYLIAGLINQGDYSHAQNLRGGSTRMTIISREGWVLMDSNPATDLTVNRRDREEFIQATQYGSGEAIRDSDTLRAETFYYAILLQDGNVLRFSRTLNSLGQVIPTILPILVMVTLVILALAYFIAHRLTIRIIKPLAEVDLEKTNIIPGYGHNESLYEEIWPFIKKIDSQRQEISKQFSTIKQRADTIEAIIANMREGLVILDEKGQVLVANKSVLDIFKFSKEKDIIGKNIRHIYRDPEFIQGVTKSLAGTHLEISFARNERNYNVFLNPVAYEKNRGAIIFFLDITEGFKAETQRREFTANVSHELKTPLTTISALSEMMVNGMAKEEDISEFATKITGHTHRLINIIDDIIRLSEFDERKIEKDFTTFDIYDLAKSVVAALQEKAAERFVEIELTGQSLTLKANSRLLDELMFNLIDNGIKYNKEGGSVTLDISEEKGWCKISVSDTGIGIAKAHQTRVFERFYRVDSSRSKRTGGTGLGLSIVKHITEHHNGKISLDSTEGVGTTITCQIRQ